VEVAPDYPLRRMTMRKTMTTVVTSAATLGLAASGFAAIGHGHAHAVGGSPLDDGTDLLPQSKITVQQAITAARSAASGGLNEVDLERASGRLLFNVDVGEKDVRVAAADGTVVAVDQDD
jgi:uncharacterized membrane protein YkoI